jgi:hypothetical protein
VRSAVGSAFPSTWPGAAAMVSAATARTRSGFARVARSFKLDDDDEFYTIFGGFNINISFYFC